MTGWVLGLSLLAAAQEPVRLGEEPGVVRHALIVGANDGGGVLEPLRYAEQDAQRVSEVLTELGGFDSELVTVLYAPSQEALRRALAEHAAIAQQYDDDLFLFFYSGHADAQGLRLGTDSYYFEGLKHDLRQVDSTVRVGMLDACRSGAITRLKGASVAPSLFEAEQLAVEGEAWLTASSAHENAQESDRLRSGFFTHYLVSGLRGAADDGDGRVDLQEVWQFTYDKVVSETSATTGGTQHPHFSMKLSGADALELTDLQNAVAQVVLPPAVEGRIAVLRLPDRIQIAEGYKRMGQPMTLALPEGSYLVRRRDGDKLYDVGVKLRVDGRITIEEWGQARLEGTMARGETESAEQFLLESEAYEQRMNLGHSPVVAGLASAVVPGAGQVYNGQVAKGLAYFGFTATMLAGSIYQPGNDQGLPPRFWPVLGAAFWAGSVADAAYNVRRREEHAPDGGGTLLWSTQVGEVDGDVRSVGFGGELILRPGVSLGLDRWQYSPRAGGGYTLRAGSRLLVYANGEKFRPGGFLGAAVLQDRVSDQTQTRPVFTAGVDLRYYLVPRYFVIVDSRWTSGQIQGFSGGVGMGIHLGR